MRRFSRFWFQKHWPPLAVFVLSMALLCCTAFVAVQQEDGMYSTSELRVVFGDDEISSLGFFNGCYSAIDTKNAMNGRLVYEQNGVKVNRGKFGHCKELTDGSDHTNVWVFYDSAQENEPCNDYIVRSETTETFDFLDASQHEWYTQFNFPLNFMLITGDDDSSHCEDMSVAVRASCEFLKLDGKIQTASEYFSKIDIDSNDTVVTEFLDSTSLFPIYVGNSTGLSFQELILFTGRRWIFLNASKVDAFDETLSSLRQFFLSTVPIGGQAGDSVMLISEAVENPKVRFTPQGVRWFYPRFLGGSDSMYPTESVYPNFPAADLTQPVNATFVCAD